MLQKERHDFVVSFFLSPASFADALLIAKAAESVKESCGYNKESCFMSLMIPGFGAFSKLWEVMGKKFGQKMKKFFTNWRA